MNLISHLIVHCILIVQFLQIALCLPQLKDDLLDEYVKYVEKRVNFKRTKPNSRPKRDLETTYYNIENSSHNDLASWWVHHEALDHHGEFVLRWFKKDNEMVFRVEAKTKGYLALGFSPDGGLNNADLIVAWYDKELNQPILWDCHSLVEDNNLIPIRDEEENYNLLSGFENDTHTVIEFSRLLDTCDMDDFVISSDTVRLIWAIHESDPDVDEPITYQHSNRNNKWGIKSLYIISPPPINKPTSLTNHQNVGGHSRKWELTLNNFVVNNNMDTLYWCKIFKSPTLQEKHHIIGYEPIIGTNHSDSVHHIILYECELSEQPNINEWESYVKAAGSACYGPFMPKAWDICLTPVIVWATGSKGEFLPNHVGIPIAEKINAYYMLEVHFDNPKLKRSVSTTGLKIHYTRHLRKNDAGIMQTGVTLSPIHVIPPKQPDYKSAGICGGDCTNAIFPKNGINVVSVLLHSHLTGKRFGIRHIRNGEELPKIIQDNHYDPSYQQSHLLEKEKVIFPGDVLITECAYRTKNRQRPTVGGYSTKQEACQAYMLYYPRTQLASCNSMPPVKYFFDVFGVKSFYEKNMKEIEELFLTSGSEPTIITPRPTQFGSYSSYSYGSEMSYEANQRAIEAIQQAKEYTIDGDTSAIDGPLGQILIKEPQEFKNKTFMSHLNELPWHESIFTKRIEESFYKGQHLMFCKKRNDILALPPSVQSYPTFKEYYDNSTERFCDFSKMFQNSSGKFKSIPITILMLILSILKNFR